MSAFPESGDTKRLNYSGTHDFSAATVLGLSSDGASIAYVTAIPFNKRLSAMPRQTMSANRTFTVDSSSVVIGGGAMVQVIADGSHTVDYSAFKEATGSSGYVNTSGIINVFYFWYDGIDYWVSIFQQIGQTPIDIVPPTLSTATVENAAPTQIVLTYSESLDTGSVPATSDFAVSGGKTVSSVVIAGSVVTLTVNSAYVYTDTITVSYTPGVNKIRDLVGNNAASLSSQAVTNNISGFVALAVNVNTANLTDNGNQTYTFATSANGRGYGNKQFTGDFILQWKYHVHPVGEGSIFSGVHTDNTNTSNSYPSIAYWISDAATNHFYYGQAGSLADSGVAATDGDLVKLVRTGSSMVASKSSDNGATWTTLRTFTGVTGTLYPVFKINATTPSGNSHLLDHPMQQGGS